MTDDGGNLISGTQAITDLFKKHFEKFLNNTRVVNRNDMYEHIIYDTVQPEILEPSIDEIKMIIKSLKINQGKTILTQNFSSFQVLFSNTDTKNNWMHMGQ